MYVTLNESDRGNPQVNEVEKFIFRMLDNTTALPKEFRVTSTLTGKWRTCVCREDILPKKLHELFGNRTGTSQRRFSTLVSCESVSLCGLGGCETPT